MNLTVLQAVETVLSFSVFVGILLWAFSSRSKAAFDQQAWLPFDEQQPGSTDTQAEQGNV